MSVAMPTWTTLAPGPKPSLRCRLFGHKWTGYTGSADTRYCIRCLRLETRDPKVTESFVHAWLKAAVGGPT